MSEDQDIVNILKPDTQKVGNVKIRKPTAGTLTLCDFAKLKIATGGATSVPFYEAIAFFYIHSQPLDEVRGLIFDKSQGEDEHGSSLAFINTVIKWADTVQLGSISSMGETIGELLVDALTPQVEPKEEDGEKIADDELSGIINPAKKK